MFSYHTWLNWYKETALSLKNSIALSMRNVGADYLWEWLTRIYSPGAPQWVRITWMYLFGACFYGRQMILALGWSEWVDHSCMTCFLKYMYYFVPLSSTEAPREFWEGWSPLSKMSVGTNSMGRLRELSCLLCLHSFCPADFPVQKLPWNLHGGKCSCTWCLN